MINFLIHFLLLIVLISSIIVILLGIVWIIGLELKEIFEIDVLWNIKRKVRNYIYADDETRREIRRNIYRRTNAVRRDRKRTSKSKGEIRKQSKGNRKGLQIRKLNIFRIRKASNQSEQSLQQFDKKSKQETERDRGKV